VLTYNKNSNLKVVGETQYNDVGMGLLGNDEAMGLRMLTRAIRRREDNSSKDECSQIIL